MFPEILSKIGKYTRVKEDDLTLVLDGTCIELFPTGIIEDNDKVHLQM
jgi:hypothetical protein